MKCYKVKELLSLLLTDELREKEKRDVKLHLAQCTECHRELEALKTTYQILSQVKPVEKMLYRSDDFLPQIRRKIRNQTALTPKWGILPKLIPALASVAIIVIGIVLFNNIRLNQVQQSIIISDVIDEENTVSGYMENLDTSSQDLVVNQMLNEIPSSDLTSLESELLALLDEDDLLSSLSETEQEVFINQILTQYQEAKDEINPDWVQLDPIELNPTS